MDSRLMHVELKTHRADPAEAEVWVTAQAERLSPTMELRGRLVGPRCEGRSTIEVAYPLRSFAHKPSQLPELAARVVIPEPSLWEPEHPFVYDAVVELWQDGVCRDQRRLGGFRVLKSGAREKK